MLSHAIMRPVIMFNHGRINVLRCPRLLISAGAPIVEFVARVEFCVFEKML
jgi:hypothetical protein